MSRQRLAAVLGVLAAVAVMVTAGIGVATYAGRDDPSAGPAHDSEPLRVSDPASGATFEVPADDWVVRGPAVRIYYADDAGQPTAVVRGPAVFKDGYCSAEPVGSNRAFAGFARDRFDAWVGALGTADSESRSAVTLSDGTDAQLRWARVHPEKSGPCPAPEVYVAMVRAADVQLVLVADTGAPGTLSDEDAEAILMSLRLR